MSKSSVLRMCALLLLRLLLYPLPAQQTPTRAQAKPAARAGAGAVYPEFQKQFRHNPLDFRPNAN